MDINKRAKELNKQRQTLAKEADAKGEYNKRFNDIDQLSREMEYYGEPDSVRAIFED